MSSRRIKQILGANAETSKATCPYLIWVSYIDDACIALGCSGEWLRLSPQRWRISRAYGSGESAWMVVDSMCQFWDGIRKADLWEKDGFIHIRAAARSVRG